MRINFYSKTFHFTSINYVNARHTKKYSSVAGDSCSFPYIISDQVDTNEGIRRRMINVTSVFLRAKWPLLSENLRALNSKQD